MAAKRTSDFVHLTIRLEKARLTKVLHAFPGRGTSDSFRMAIEAGLRVDKLVDQLSVATMLLYKAQLEPADKARAAKLMADIQKDSAR